MTRRTIARRAVRRLLPACALLATVTLAACGGDDADGGPSDPARDTFATALNVDLAQMQQVAPRVYVRDLVEGTGAAAANNQRLSVRYTGWLPNGSQFDSNRSGTPYSFRLGRGEVITGWDVGVLGMKVGGTRQLVFGSEYGYGRSGAGAIPPNSTLVFEVQLLGIQ